MSGSAIIDLQYLYYQVQLCVPDTLHQGLDALKLHLAVALLIRLIAASRTLRPAIMNIICTFLGVWLVWYNYGYIVWYGVALAGFSYALLATGVPFKGPILGIFAVIYIVSWYVCVHVSAWCVRVHKYVCVCASVPLCVHVCVPGCACVCSVCKGCLYSSVSAWIVLPQCSELFAVEPTKWHEIRGAYSCFSYA